MYRAGLTAQGCWDKFDEYDKQALNKFAELIVRECIDIAEQTRYDGKVVAERIKFVFGVEE
jgi:hypothetical protein